MTPTENTCRLLSELGQRYPEARARDYMKFLFQSSFGCEHLVSDRAAAARKIREEAAEAPHGAGPITEPLDGPWCRVSLDALREGLSPETMAALFILSAEHRPEALQALQQKLAVLRELTAQGELPLRAEELEVALSDWAAAGYPACHHSEHYRRAYRPAYRLMKTAYARFLPLFCAIDGAMAAGKKPMVVIDGMCAGGKTTLGALLQQVYGCTVFHMDDFFLRPEQRTAERLREIGGNADRERFAAEVLMPLRAGRPAMYRPFSCRTMEVGPGTVIEPVFPVVTEGSYSLHPALDYGERISVFLRIDPRLQLQRILEREGPEHGAAFKDRWIPMEQAYFEAFGVEAGCDFVFDTGEEQRFVD